MLAKLLLPLSTPLPATARLPLRRPLRSKSDVGSPTDLARDRLGEPFAYQLGEHR